MKITEDHQIGTGSEIQPHPTHPSAQFLVKANSSASPNNVVLVYGFSDCFFLVSYVASSSVSFRVGVSQGPALGAFVAVIVAIATMVLSPCPLAPSVTCVSIGLVTHFRLRSGMNLSWSLLHEHALFRRETIARHPARMLQTCTRMLRGFIKHVADEINRGLADQPSREREGGKGGEKAGAKSRLSFVAWVTRRMGLPLLG